MTITSLPRVWKEWLIDGNEFKEMTMPDGDDCRDKKRQTRVITPRIMLMMIISHGQHVLSSLTRHELIIKVLFKIALIIAEFIDWQVIFTCSQEDTSRDAHIVSVVEPATCEYLMTVATHLTCFNHSLKVYPFLPQASQEQWDELEWRYEAGEVTEKVGNP